MGFAWPWRRRAAAAPAPASAPAPGRQPAPMGWAHFPPIQRSLDAPIGPLSRDFAPGTWLSPAFTGRVTHAVADAAPGGLIDADGGGPSAPVPDRRPAPELTLLPPPRPAAARRVQRSSSDRPDPTFPSAPRSGLVEADPASLPVVQPSVVPDEPPADEPPVVQADRDDELAADPDPTGELAPGHPAVETGDTDAGHRLPDAASSTPPAPPVGDRPRLGLGAPLSQVPDRAVTTPPETPQPAATDGFTAVSIPHAGVRRPTPHTPADPPAGPRPGPLPVQRSADRPARTPTPAPPETESSATVTPAEEGPVDSDAAPDIAAPPDDATPAAPAPVGEFDGPTPQHDPPPVATPAISATALPLAAGIRTSLQRTTALPGPGRPAPVLAVRPAATPKPPAGPPVRVQRVAHAPSAVPTDRAAPVRTGPASRPPRPVGAASPAGPAPIDGAGDALAPEPPSGPGTAVLAQRATPTDRQEPAAVQRSQAPWVRPEAPMTPTVPSLGLPVAGAHVATSQPSTATSGVAMPVQRLGLGDMSDAASTASDAADGLGSAAATATDAVADTATDTATDLGDAAGGIADTAGGVGETAGGLADAARGAASSVGSAATAAADRATDGKPEDVEAMARRLFPPMLRMMRSQLLVDRERRGIRTDRW